jgi:MFS family permease
MLAGLFLWPQLSDHIGRKPVMAMSLVGSSVGLAAQAFVISTNGSLACFLATRVLTGSFAGSSPVAKAYLADVGFKDGNLPRYLAMRDAASTMAYIIGPVLGGGVYELRRRLLGLAEGGNSLAFVIYISALASLVAGIYWSVHW